MITINSKTTYGLRRNTDIIPEMLLLDEFPNAAAAYSLRLLSSSYTGDCIQVRRSSDNSLQNIGFVNGVLDTASLLSFVGSGDGFVRTWYDQSGNGRNLLPTAGNPVNEARIILNGNLDIDNLKPTMFFENRRYNIFPSINTTNSIYSTFMVTRKTQTTSIGSVFSGGNGSFNTRYSQDSTSITILRNQQAGIISLGGLVNNTQYLASLFTSNLGNSIHINNLLENSNLTNPSFIGGLGTFGGNSQSGEGFRGNIQETIFYTTDQSTNRTAIESNINDYYNIF
jgi:hypothetical protein